MADKAPIALNLAYVAGSNVRSVAPASITSTCLDCNILQASRTAAIEEAQAASVA